MNQIICVGLILCSMTLCGCMNLSAKKDPSRFYILSSQEGGEKLKRDARYTLGVARVMVPDYLNRPQMAIEVRDGELIFAEFDRWASPLDRDITRVLSKNLSCMLQDFNIVGLPLPTKMERDYDLYVTVIDFKPELCKSRIYFQAQFSIMDVKDSTQIYTGMVTLVEPLDLCCYDYLKISRLMGVVVERFAKRVVEGFNRCR